MPNFSSSEDYCAAQRGLIEAWCDRRCLHALSCILDPYISFAGLTDSWANLNAGLYSVRARAQNELTLTEMETVNDLIADAERIIYR